MPPIRSSPALARFLDRVRKAFAHDLRTPLGAIVNYAAVLEAAPGSSVEDVQDLARRIRGNAQRATRMIQVLASAVDLASRPLRASSTDLASLAAALLSDAGGRGEVREHPSGARIVADVDAEVLGFAWRAWIAVQADAAGKPVDVAQVRLVAPVGSVVVELSASAGSDPGSGDRVDLGGYLRHNGGAARLETALGLALAEEVVVLHGGELGVWGRPGDGSGLRVRFPESP
jgi:signal transduction histidine kinase